MKRGSEENNHETSPSPTQRLRCREISTGGETSGEINISLDLTVEILKKLPAKSLVRFQCVSKQWSAIIGYRRNFIDSIVSRSLTQPLPRGTHLIFHHHSENILRPNNFFIFSSTYPQNTEKESIYTLNAGGIYQYVRGLILYWKDIFFAATIYNPTTRQSISLPQTKHMHLYSCNCFFGYDPLENQYKVLRLPKGMEQSCQVFTLGDNKWRNIQCSVGLHFPVFSPVCINGVIYYRASTEEYGSTYVLVSFDVRSETFHHLKAPRTQMDHHWTLVNYQGKLGFIYCQNGVEIWIMEDSEKKQEWTKIVCYEMEGFEKVHIGGVARGGEIVIVPRLLLGFDTLAVFFYDPKRNSMRCVEVEGTRVKDKEHNRKHLIRLWAVPDHVENTMRL